MQRPRGKRWLALLLSSSRGLRLRASLVARSSKTHHRVSAGRAKTYTASVTVQHPLQLKCQRDGNELYRSAVQPHSHLAQRFRFQNLWNVLKSERFRLYGGRANLRRHQLLRDKAKSARKSRHCGFAHFGRNQLFRDRTECASVALDGCLVKSWRHERAGNLNEPPRGPSRSSRS